MLHSVRRVASTAAVPSGGLTSALASCVLPKTPTTAASVPFLRRGHQRRASSSKPSRSDNGASDLPDQSVPASASSARGQSKAGSEKRKRKASDRNALKKLPSVPNTHHMVGEALGLSSFFSLHRPISITQTMPKTVTDEQFASIFAPRTKATRMTDAMSTLSTTIDQLEGPMASLTIDGQQDHHHHHHGDGMSRLEVKHHDGSESSIYLQVDAMSGDFLPFRPPPIPQPQSQTTTTGNYAAEAEDMTADMDAAGAAEDVPHHRVYKAMFTIEESMEADGQIRIIAHTPQILQNEQQQLVQSVQQQQQPRSFVERLAQRQLKLDETRGRRDLYAISVRRQRKLRMKKKKYKKLMRRTRNERRKLDRN